MKTPKQFILVLIGWLLTNQASAVFFNEKGLGEVSIIPYYTVNNNLNTLVTVTNTTYFVKAVKINFRESLNGHTVLSYNVYLGPYDTWSFGLVPTTSSLTASQGQASAKQISFDQSCAPFLNKAGEEFTTENIIDGAQSLQRTREGYIEIIEMGQAVLNSPLDFFAEIGASNGHSCYEIQLMWQEIWNEDTGGDTTSDLSSPTGGLTTEAQLIDVAEGINYSIPTIALDDFHVDGAITHVHPDDASLSLDVAKPVANLFANNKSYEVTFDSGIDAVSAVLMSDQLISTYALDAAIAAKTETIYTQPTRRFYLQYDNLATQPPFNTNVITANCSAEQYGGIEFEQTIFDRESQSRIAPTCNVTCPPEPPQPGFCGSVFVQGFKLPSTTIQQPPAITLSTNAIVTDTVDYQHATENGFVRTEFNDTRPLIGIDTVTGNPVEIHGIPITGVTLQRFTNAGAGEGLLAQYGGGQLIKSTTKIVEQEQ